jgi:hypothetical protein
MFFREYLARFLRRTVSPISIIHLASLLLVGVLCLSLKAQELPSYQREFDTAEKISLSVKNRDGRVTVIASEELKSKAIIEARHYDEGQRWEAGS